MSQFDRYTETEYVQNLRCFLKLPKTGFVRAVGLTTLPAFGRKGRLPRYSSTAVQNLEESVNSKARRAETTSASEFSERFCIARDYLQASNAEVARLVGVSRELTRMWSNGTLRPKDLTTLAHSLDVPALWLEFGGEEHLPADSHVGVRVGFEAMEYREQLYGMTTAILADAPDEADESQIQAYIEQSVRTVPEMSHSARRAGGRWQVVGGLLQFAPWVPINVHGLSRRFWCDEVEAMIEEELSSKPSVYSAWSALKLRCDERGLKYPKLISLHKRMAKARQRTEQFGISLTQQSR